FERSTWPWRDWVIDAFNDNLSYDRFISHQLAGDLLPNPSIKQRVATGYLFNHRVNVEGGAIAEECLAENVADRVETTATAFLGLTMGCARCHDHKYDPISQRDFYRFFAFFNNLNEVHVAGITISAPFAPVLELASAEQKQQLEQLSAQLKETN